MQIVEITGAFSMDTGAPEPFLVSNESKVGLLFYATEEDEYLHTATACSPLLVMLEFTSCLKFSLGSPNDETLSGHPFYEHGLNSYGFFEVKDSPLIDDLKEINSVHPYYNKGLYEAERHFIITFHDSTFECVAESYRVTVKRAPVAVARMELMDALHHQ
ncbi:MULTISPECIES: hypothetical protein [unclassified Mucilaginibacter]|uniref:hypothetical protein n=1 Tax=unclassified Mucilaginibacter TaxID=2617802 RepID=UPI000A7B6C07|nr:MULTISPECIES: hypothetical protein [unclassified Mucilaginibacter]HEK20796.1 hypothetical protein [Bacteroidota bacterium]